MMPEGSTSLRIEPLEAALSQILANRILKPSKGRERRLSSTGSHGNTGVPIFKLVGEQALKVRVCTCGEGESGIFQKILFGSSEFADD